MKICFVMPTPFSLGGEQRVVSVIASLLKKEGHDVSILCFDNSFPINYNIYNLDKDVKILFVRKRNILEKIDKFINEILKKINGKFSIFKNNKIVLEKIICDKYSKSVIEENIKNEKFDVIIGVSGYYSLIVSKISKKIKVKRIGWQHNSFDAYFRNKRRYYWNQEALFKKLIPKLDEYIVLTNYDRKKIKQEWNVNCTTIYNPKSFEATEISNLNNNVFLAAGRLTYAKGYDNLIKAFKIFCTSNDKWKLKIVGEGEERNNLINMIKEYELEDRIEICPFTDNIQEYFKNCSALLLTSRWEGMPMIALESLEMGVPIIAFDIPVVKEIIENEKDGLIVKQGDIEQYALKLETYTKNKENIIKMGKNAKDKSNIFSFEKILSQWNSLLNK